MTDRDVIGAVGQVVNAIRGKSGPGEVLLRIGGTRECYIAESDEPIERGQTVLVVDVAPHRHVTVVRWTELPVPE
ncbi:MAG: hypothetical protein ACR2M5_00735 [Nakamurella sp.]